MKVMKMTTHDCIHEDQLLGQSRKIAELETRSDYKEKQITDLNRKMDLMDRKIDKLIDGFNDLKMQSKQDDAKLELRLKTIETRLDEQEKAFNESKEKDKENRDRNNYYFGIIGIAVAILTFFFTFFR